MINYRATTGILVKRWAVAHVVSVDDNGSHDQFLRWPIEDMPHFVLFCFIFFVVNRAKKLNYRVINEKLSHHK